MDHDQVNQVISLLLLLISLAVLYRVAAWATAPVTAGDVEQWSVRHAVALEAADVTVVRRYLARSRAWRRIGLAVPVVVTLLIMFVWVSAQGVVRPNSPAAAWAPAPVAWVTSPLAWALAYMVGAVAAELTWPRRQPLGRRGAAVSARRVSQYLPAWVRWTIRASPLVAVSGLAVVALVPQRYDVPYSRDVAGAAVITGIILLVVGVVELALRIVVARPQPAPTAHAVAVDDALRTTALQALAGAGLATLGVLLEEALARVAYVFEIGKITDDNYWIYVTNGLGIVRIALVVAGLLAWQFVTGSQRWRVRRPLRPGGVLS